MRRLFFFLLFFPTISLAVPRGLRLVMPLSDGSRGIPLENALYLVVADLQGVDLPSEARILQRHIDHLPIYATFVSTRSGKLTPLFRDPAIWSTLYNGSRVPDMLSRFSELNAQARLPDLSRTYLHAEVQNFLMRWQFLALALKSQALIQSHIKHVEKKLPKAPVRQWWELPRFYSELDAKTRFAVAALRLEAARGLVYVNGALATTLGLSEEQKQQYAFHLVSALSELTGEQTEEQFISLIVEASTERVAYKIKEDLQNTKSARLKSAVVGAIKGALLASIMGFAGFEVWTQTGHASSAVMPFLPLLPWNGSMVGSLLEGVRTQNGLAMAYREAMKQKPLLFRGACAQVFSP